MGIRPKSESSCQTQLTIPPFVTKKKIRESKSYMKNLHFPKIPSGKDVNILQRDSRPEACVPPTSDDTIENIVLYEQPSTEKPCKDAVPGVDSRKLLSYKSFFKQNKFSRHSCEDSFAVRLQPKDEPESGTTEKPIFVKDNLQIASEVSNFLKYLRRKGTDFLTMFDLDNLNGLIDDISNMKHFAEPVSYEDSAATLRTDSSNRQDNDADRKSSRGSARFFRKSVSANMEITPESPYATNLESAARFEENVHFDEVGKVSFDSAKHQSLHSAVRNPVAVLFGQEVDDKCLPRGKALKCVTVARDKHVRVYIKGKSTCTTIDLCPEYLAHAGHCKSNVESASEELVQDMSFSEDASSGDVKTVRNVSGDGAVEVRDTSFEDRPVSEKRDQTSSNNNCDIFCEVQVEALQQRLLFLEVCKKLNKAKMSGSSSSGIAKGVSEDLNISDDRVKDWKTEFARDSDKAGAYFREEASVTTINHISQGHFKVQTPTLADHTSTALVREGNLKVGTLSKEKLPPRLVKSDLNFGHEASFNRNASHGAGGQIFSDEAKCCLPESSLTDGTGFSNKFPSLASRCDKVDTVMVLTDDGADLKGDARVSAEKISLRNKMSYLDVTERHDKFGNESEEPASFGDPNAVSKSEEDFHADSNTKPLNKNIHLEIVSSKNNMRKYELTVRVSPFDSSAGKASDDSRRAESKQKGGKLPPYALGSICSKSADLVVDENVSRLLDRVVKSSVELEKFDFKFANFNQIFVANVGRNLETPSSSDIDVTRTWKQEGRGPSSNENVDSDAPEDPGPDLEEANKSGSESKEEQELVSERSSANTPKDSSRRRPFYRKRYVKKILFASEESRESDKTEESSNLESSQSNISSVLDAVSDTLHTNVRFLEEDLVCSKIYPRPRCDLCLEERPEDSPLCADDDVYVTRGADQSDCNNHFLTTVEEISRGLSEEFLSIRNKMHPTATLVASPDKAVAPLHSVRFGSIIALNSARTYAHSSLLNADLERLKSLCEDAIRKHSLVDDDDDVAEFPTEDEITQVPALISATTASGSLMHSYCGTDPEAPFAEEESYCEEESPVDNAAPMPTTTPTTNDVRSLLYRKRPSPEAKVHSFMTANKSDKSLSKDRYKVCPPSGSGHPNRQRTIISCKTAFTAEESPANNAKRVENLVHKLCQKLNFDHPHSFNNPDAFVSHFEKVGRKLYLTPIDKLKSDLKFVLGRGSKETKPPFRREDAFRQKAKVDSKREPVDRNAKLREKIAKMKRKPA